MIYIAPKSEWTESGRVCRYGEVKRACCWLVSGIFKPSRHVAMVWNLETSPWLPRNMIHVGNFPVTSRRLPRNFPRHVSRGRFGEVGVIEFGLNWVQWHYSRWRVSGFRNNQHLPAPRSSHIHLFIIILDQGCSKGGNAGGDTVRHFFQERGRLSICSLKCR